MEAMQSSKQINHEPGTARGQDPVPSVNNPLSPPEFGSEGAAEGSLEPTSESGEDDMSAELESILEPDPSLVAGLEVDMNGNNDGINGSDANAIPNYGTSIYPRVQLAYQVEHPFGNAGDSATIDSSRTLYAEDIDYVWENGRRYCGDYCMPNDANEQTRQYVLHQAYLKLLDLELTTVQLHNPEHILDIGTGIGEWAIGVAEKYPNCEVFGTDIAAIQPTDQVPFNVEFQIEDAREEWIRPADSFDLVHLRNMAGAFSDWSFIYQQAFACLKPGGYIEIMDFDDHWGSENFLDWFPEGSPVEVMATALREAAILDGRPKGVSHMDQQLLMDVGFVDIHQSRHDLPVGRRENSKFGDDWLFALVTGVEATCFRLLTKYKGWDAESVRDLCDRVSRDLMKMAEDPKRAKGFVVKIRVLVGRKPEMPGQWTAQALGEHGEIRDYSGDESTIESLSRCRSYATETEREAKSETEVEMEPAPPT